MSPWDVARAVWPGAFEAPVQDRQIEAGLGDYPAVAVAWKSLRPAGRGSGPRVLRVLELRPSLQWRYRSDGTEGVHVLGYGRGRVQDALVAVAGRIGLVHWAMVHVQGPVTASPYEVRAVQSHRRYPVDLGALNRLIDEGILPEPWPHGRAAALLAGHRRREERIVARQHDLPLFGGRG